MKKLALKLIRLYQALPLTSTHFSCRFTPRCSEYAYQAITKYGIVRGSLLGIYRILRCNPLSTPKYDPC